MWNRKLKAFFVLKNWNNKSSFNYLRVMVDKTFISSLHLGIQYFLEARNVSCISLIRCLKQSEGKLVHWKIICKEAIIRYAFKTSSDTLCFNTYLVVNNEDHTMCLMKASLGRHQQINSTHCVVYFIQNAGRGVYQFADVIFSTVPQHNQEQFHRGLWIS